MGAVVESGVETGRARVQEGNRGFFRHTLPAEGRILQGRKWGHPSQNGPAR
jgi:hypothetical protein